MVSSLELILSGFARLARHGARAIPDSSSAGRQMPVIFPDRRARDGEVLLYSPTQAARFRSRTEDANPNLLREVEQCTASERSNCATYMIVCEISARREYEHLTNYRVPVDSARLGHRRWCED